MTRAAIYINRFLFAVHRSVYGHSSFFHEFRCIDVKTRSDHFSFFSAVRRHDQVHWLEVMRMKQHRPRVVWCTAERHTCLPERNDGGARHVTSFDIVHLKLEHRLISRGSRRQQQQHQGQQQGKGQQQQWQQQGEGAAGGSSSRCGSSSSSVSTGRSSFGGQTLTRSRCADVM